MSDIEEPGFITIAANGMQPESESSSSYSAGESAITTPSPRTHDTSRSVYHVKDLREFSLQLNEAARRAFPNKSLDRNRYKDAEVVLIRWKDDNRLGVSCELEDLARVFVIGYGFKTTTWLIPTEDPLEDIMGRSLSLIKEAGKEGKLLVVYYAGHAAMNEDRQQVWFRTGQPKEGFLEWFAIQQLFLKAKADVLFLLDCCAAASATTKSQFVSGVKETIGACGFESKAPEPGSHSFTCELIEVLNKWKEKAPFSVAMLHSELLANLRHPKPKRDMFGQMVESRRTPVYVVTTSNARAVSIELGRRHAQRDSPSEDSRPQKRRRMSPNESSANWEDFQDSKSSADIPPSSTSDDASATPHSQEDQPGAGKYAKDQLNRVLPGGDLAIPHVLVSLALEGEQLLEIGAWKKWLSDCPCFAKYAKVEGLYRSHSSLLILSLPVIIWDMLPDNQACSFIGYVNSSNHIRQEICRDSQDLETWLSSEVEWENDWGSLPSAGPSISRLNTSHDENSTHSPELPHLVSRPSTESTIPLRQHIVHTEPTSELMPIAPWGEYRPSGTPLEYGSNVTHKPPNLTENVSEDVISTLSLAESMIQPPGQDLSSDTQQLDTQAGRQQPHISSGYTTTAISRDEYTYSSLGQRNDIRLVLLQPGHKGDIVQISLINASFDESPRYEAMSYTWGDSYNDGQILVDNQTFSISRNLADALLFLRLEDKPRTLWIDAICINQADIAERNAQISKMRAIYQFAKQVVVWLGPETDSSRKAFEYLNRNGTKLLLGNSTQIPSQKSLDSIWGALTLDIFARPYWKRLWILQEITNATQIQVVCGSSTIDGDLLLASRKLGPIHHPFPYFVSLQAPIKAVEESLTLSWIEDLGWSRQRKIEGFHSISIKELLMNTQTFQCTDPRDRIYALLGLADTDHQIIKPDYRKSLREVYTEFAKSHIKKYAQIDIILPRRKSRISELPSWVPNWNQPPMALGTFDSSYNLYDAANRSSLSASLSSPPFELYLKGFMFRSIEQVAVVVNFKPDQHPPDLGLVGRVMGVTSSGSWYLTGEEMTIAIARTLTGDLNWKGERLRQGSTILDLWRENFNVPDNEHPHQVPRDQQLRALRRSMLEVFYRSIEEMRFVVLHEGYIGLAPGNVRVGDLVCIIFGCRLPVVLRKEDGRYIFIGSCYVHGIMDGEAMDQFQGGKLKGETFILV
ncbi:uncharacterized protein PAC_19530 [Phialocephala subalpina]|uniref:Heterokaryon incompatibility domain-containing protein n=1 Tax=Phialocephala subalpina TaxID=576137 RepID=A0A1L7XXA6_9HELO|nr:uncharacterized protein PAC_19530 [Phialocephala subalpina]